MREKHRLSAVALGTLLCSIVPAATHAQDKLERYHEQPQIIAGHSLEAVTAALKTTAATGVAAGEVARGNVASRAGIEVQLLRLRPLGQAGPGLADLVEQSDRTEVIVTLTGAPPDLLSPSLVAEIHVHVQRLFFRDDRRIKPRSRRQLIPAVRKFVRVRRQIFRSGIR